MGSESILLVVQQEAQAALGWLLATAFFLAIGWFTWRTLTRRRDIVALVLCIVLALTCGVFTVQAARAFWLDAFTPPIRIEGRINRLWTKRSYSFVLGLVAPRFGDRPVFRDAYASIGGRTVQLTWDVYASLEVGQRVALDVGRGSGRAMAISH